MIIFSAKPIPKASKRTHMIAAFYHKISITDSTEMFSPFNKKEFAKNEARLTALFIKTVASEKP